jgi:hypothetical protein
MAAVPGAVLMGPRLLRLEAASALAAPEGIAAVVSLLGIPFGLLALLESRRRTRPHMTGPGFNTVRGCLAASWLLASVFGVVVSVYA